MTTPIGNQSTASPNPTLDQEAHMDTTAGVYLADAPKQCTVTFADIANSTGIKETQTETAWVKGTTFLYAGAYATLAPSIKDIAWVKFLGDGVMTVVPAQYAAEALSSMIKLLELVNDANKPRAGGKGEIDYNIAVGVASGPAIEVTMPDGRRDFIGHTADRASRLSSIATPNALLVDAGTVAAANMTLLESRIGEALERPVEEYLGPRESVHLRGFAQPTPYHEVLWAKQFFGVKSENLTTSTARLEAVTRGESVSPPLAVSAKPTVPARPERKVGTVKSWNLERGFGFLTADGEDFHLSPRHVVYQEDLPHLVGGQKVAFVVGTGSGRSREALAVLLVGREAEGYITAVPADKPHGWIRVTDPAGNAHPVYMPRAELPADVARGMAVDFRVEAGPRGAYAAGVQRLEEAA